MFVIREAQFDALGDARREDFVRAMMDRLRGLYDAVAAMDAATLRALVEEGTAAAESYGLLGDDDIPPFLECRVVYGPEFPLGDDDDWAREVLEDDGLDGDEKAHHLAGQLAMLAQVDDTPGAP